MRQFARFYFLFRILHSTVERKRDHCLFSVGVLVFDLRLIVFVWVVTRMM